MSAPYERLQFSWFDEGDSRLITSVNGSGRKVFAVVAGLIVFAPIVLRRIVIG